MGFRTNTINLGFIKDTKTVGGGTNCFLITISHYRVYPFPISSYIKLSCEENYLCLAVSKIFPYTQTHIQYLFYIEYYNKF